MAKDNNSKFKELDAIIAEDSEGSRKIYELITSIKKQYLTVKVGEFELKVVATLPQSARYLQIKLRGLGAKEENTETVDEFTDLLCESLASMCVEAPFNSPESWKIVDKETGGVPEIFGKVVSAINSSEKKIIEFR